MLPETKTTPRAQDRETAAVRESRWIDYALIGAMSAFALHCAGEGVNQPISGWILIGILCLGTLTSYLIGRIFKGTPFVVLDGWVYLAAAMTACLFQGVLNLVLPEDTFPPEIWTCGLLCWMLTLGSFGTWRDGPLLFQAVPGLALFGLVGVYDTFPEAPFYFFGYLLCLAVLFGRAHARAMLVQAHQSGFSRIEEGVSLSEENSEEDAMLNAMRRGPWRWMAGPEWALASAATVVVISLIGAPVLRTSVKDFSGFVQVNLPKTIRPNLRSNDATTQSLVRVGNGPRTLSSTIIMLAKLDHPRYLRLTTYTNFQSPAWTPDVPSKTQAQVADARAELVQSFINPRRYVFDVQPRLAESREVPLPAEVVRVTNQNGHFVSADGTYQVDGIGLHLGTFVGESIEPGVGPGDPNHPETFESVHDTVPSEANSRVQELVDQITANKKTDYDKANAIMQEIGRRCKYNLKAAATPSGVDAVECFLFDQPEGYCDLFATTMVVMARAAGISARYATGYLPNNEESKDRPGYFVVRESDAHAWAELYFKGVGWVVFDATSLAKDVTPGGINRTGAFDWRPPLVMALSLALIGGVWFGITRLRSWKTSVPPEVVVRKRLGRAYSQFADRLARITKLRRLPNLTPDEWIEQVGPYLGSLSEPARKLNAQFVSALYAPTPLSDDQLTKLEGEVRDFLKLKRVDS